MSRPPFELVMQDPPEPLPARIRLTDEDQLAGHTIKAVYDGHGSMTFVTDTLCWLTVKAEGDSDCCDPDHYITVERDNYYGPGPAPAGIERDIKNVRWLREHGILTKAEADLVQQRQDEEERERNIQRANRLRREADALMPRAAP